MTQRIPDIHDVAEEAHSQGFDEGIEFYKNVVAIKIDGVRKGFIEREKLDKEEVMKEGSWDGGFVIGYTTAIMNLKKELGFK